MERVRQDDAIGSLETAGMEAIESREFDLIRLAKHVERAIEARNPNEAGFFNSFHERITLDSDPTGQAMDGQATESPALLLQ
jgi:hypothetical protein